MVKKVISSNNNDKEIKVEKRALGSSKPKPAPKRVDLAKLRDRRASGKQNKK